MSLGKKGILRTREIGATCIDGVSRVHRHHGNIADLSDITAVVAISVIQVALSSAIVTGDFKDQEAYFGVSSEVIALTVSLTVCGFG